MFYKRIQDRPSLLFRGWWLFFLLDNALQVPYTDDINRVIYMTGSVIVIDGGYSAW